MAARAISFPMGSKKRAGKLPHNRRESEGLSENIDRDRIKDTPPHNVNQSLDDAYKHLFGKAVEEYNAKQKRNDRKVKDNDYYKKLFGNANKNEVAVSSNKEMSFYEFIIQVGDKDDTGCGEWKPLPPHLNTEGLTLRDQDGKPEYFEWSEAGKVATLCLDEWFNGNEALGIKSFQERNPNFYVFLDSTHIDEATPHKHVNYIPWAEFDKGIGVRNSHSQALRQMGYGKYDGDNNKERVAVERYAIHEWKLKERSIFEKICNEHGFEIKPMEKGRGKDLSVPEIKKAKETLKADLIAEILKDVNAEKARIEQDIEILRHDLSSTKEEFFIENEKAEAVRVERDNLAAEIETQNTTKANNKDEIEAQEGKLTEINATVTALEENKGTLKKELEELQAETEQHRKTLADAEARLQEALEPIEEQIDVALAEKANINVIKDIAVKKSLTGAIVLSRETKGKTLTVEQVESALELAKNQRSHESRCNNKVKAAEKAVAEVKEKAQEDVGAAKRETAEHKAVAKEATDAWRDTIAVYNGVTSNNKPYVTSPADVPKAAKFFKDGYYEQKKASESVPEFERQVKALTSQVSTLQQERDTAKNALQRTENALSKGLDCFTFTKEGNKVMVGCDFNAFTNAVKGEKPDHRVLERCRERERELNRMLNIGLSR